MAGRLPAGAGHCPDKGAGSPGKQLLHHTSNNQFDLIFSVTLLQTNKQTSDVDLKAEKG